MSNEEKILKIMYKNHNKIFIYNDFREIASLETLRKDFLRLLTKKKILKVYDGMYTIMNTNKIVNKIIYPNVIEFSYAFARKFNWNIYPSGETALNIVGLSSQISNNYEFLSDGRYKTVNYQDNQIKFKKTAKKNINLEKYECTILSIALNYLQESNLKESDDIIISKYISDNNIKSSDLKYANYWIYKKVLESEKNNDKFIGL